MNVAASQLGSGDGSNVGFTNKICMAQAYGSS